MHSISDDMKFGTTVSCSKEGTGISDRAVEETLEGSGSMGDGVVKYRAACDVCFSAKVKCSGSQPTCSRCREKDVPCKYSVSMVGKVVGKRKKRQLSSSRMKQPRLVDWNGTHNPNTHLPSPAPSDMSVRPNQTATSMQDWTSFISFDEVEAHFDGLTSTDQSGREQVSQCRPEAMGNTSIPVFVNLPTPSESPPNLEYVTPSSLHVQTEHNSPKQTLTPAAHSQPVSYDHLTPATVAIDDDQTVCLNLLTHLRHAMSKQHTYSSLLSLVSESNAILERVVRRKSVRSDYVCQLYLSAVCTYLTSLCEQLCCIPTSKIDLRNHHSTGTRPESMLRNNLVNECFDTRIPHAQVAQVEHHGKTIVHRTTLLCSTIADLLKRKPLSGFQILGRHESAHIDLEMRLKRVLSSF